MKILLIAPRFHTNLAYQLAALRQGGHQIGLVTLYRGQSEYQDIKPTVVGFGLFARIIGALAPLFKHSYLKSSWEMRLASPPLLKTWRLIYGQQPDLIILKAYQNMLALTILIMAKLKRRPVILTVQTNKEQIFGSSTLLRLYLKLLRALGMIAIITPVQQTVETLHRVGYHTVYYLPFCIDVPNRLPAKPKSDAVRILSVGKYIRRKDQLTLLRAVTKLIPTYPLRVTLVGEPADQEYVRVIDDFITASGLAQLVTKTYHVPYSAMLDLYRTHDLFILPSYDEPAAYSPVEAMAQGLPVIVSTECGTNCYIKDGRNGHIFAARSTDDLVDKIIRCIEPRSQLTRLGAESHRLAEKFHSTRSFLDAFNHLLIVLSREQAH